MTCQHCGSKLYKRRTVVVNGHMSTGDIECKKCDKSWVFVSVIMHEKNGAGSGCNAEAKKLRKIIETDHKYQEQPLASLLQIIG